LTSVVNCTIVIDPTVWQSGFNLCHIHGFSYIASGQVKKVSGTQSA